MNLKTSGCRQWQAIVSNILLICSGQSLMLLVTWSQMGMAVQLGSENYVFNPRGVPNGLD